MNKKKMLLKEPIQNKKEKNHYLTENKELKQPLLQIFFKNSKKDKLLENKASFPKSSKSPKFNSSFNFNFQKKTSEKDIKEKNEKNVPPIKKLKNNRYILSNNQFKKDNDIYSYIKDHETNEKQNKNKFNNNHISRNTKNKNNTNTLSILLNNNNSLFPNLNGNANLFRLRKKTNEEINLEEKNKPNDLVYNNINLKNFNSNSIFVPDSRPKKFTFFKKFLGDQISAQKSVNINNINSFKNLNSEESYLNKISNLRINTEIDKDDNNNNFKIEKLNKSNNSKKANLNSLLENSELNKKLINEKSLLMNNIKINKPIHMENYPEIKKKKNFISIIPRNDAKNLKLSMFSSSKEKTLPSPNENNNNKRRIFYMKNNQINDINDKIVNNINPNKFEMQKNANIENENPSINTINNISLGRVYNSFINKNRYNLLKERNSFNKEIFINNGSEDLDNDKIKFNLRPKQQYLDSCSIFLFKEEENFYAKKRIKINEKLKNIKPKYEFNLSQKKEFLKNCIFDKIKQNIFDEEAINKLKEEEKRKKLKIMQKYLLEIFNFILSKPNEFYNFQNIDNLGLYFFIEKGINTSIKISYNLGIFNMLKEYAKDIEEKWNTDNAIIYKKLSEFYSFRKYLNDNSNFYEIIDRKYFLYKELLRKDYNLYLETINFFEDRNKIKNKKMKKNKIAKISAKKVKKFEFKRSQTPNIKAHRLKKLESIKENNNNKSSNDEIEKARKNSSFIKIQNEFGFARGNTSKKLTHINKILPKKTKKKINIVNIINNNSKDSKENKTQKEIAFNDATLKVDKYNVLKNIEFFSKKKKKENLFENIKIFNFGSIKNLKVEEIINKLTNFKLTEDTLEPKKEENEKDTSEEKLLNEFIAILNKKEIEQYFTLLKSNEKGLINMINKKEAKTGNTLLIYAVENNLESVAESLLIKGADPNIQNNSGDTALNYAYKNKNNFMVNLLVKYNADQNIKRINDNLPEQMH